MEAEKDLIFFKTKGTSMRPFFETGDMFIVEKIETNNLKIGDIIAYYTTKHKDVVCHRLIKKVCCGDSYVIYTRADMAIKSTETVKEEDLIGKVIAVIRNGRVTSLVTAQQYFINRAIVLFLPFARRIYNILKRGIYFYGGMP